ncbi:FAD/NAD(P)-binding domain-containing protein [Aspergillus bertholletiae]|uniref:FAD/NAD(P)-binding domain-containing protein n=1 Tax=Aspergillus bertholletiae TaxID=1226010 RepID=A0A5N7ARL1_9EURO|nr:FAD/NAD(P)-binding domain-containing protein [Aspergillus bertholletiae]
MSTADRNLKLRVAVIGAGPAGLGAAIEFQKLPFVDLRIYEQAKELREVGAGISIQRNTWRMLDILGVYDNIDRDTIFSAADGHSVQHRNGRTGELLLSNGQDDTPPRQKHARALRSVLQQALLTAVDQTKLRLSSRLVEISELPNKALSLRFADGHADEVDLLIGADGVRSVVRKFSFPEHQISYTGTTAFRALVNANDILSIPNFPDAVTFWHGPTRWVYTCNLNGGNYEITARTDLPETRKTVSWGQDARPDEFRVLYKDFAPIIQEVLSKIGEVKKFPLFAGPRLSKVISHGSIALIGDASHPLSGAFGAGAGFALEDAYVLAGAVQWAHDRDIPVSRALDLYDKVRSPHYKDMYDILDGFKRSDISTKGLSSFDEIVLANIQNKWTDDHHWLYHYDVQDVWKKAYEEEDARRGRKRHDTKHVKHVNVSSHL